MDQPPVPPQRPHVHTEHGRERPDPWVWLRHKDDPEVIAHLQAENAWTESCTAHLDPLRKRLYAEILGRIQEDDTSVPWPRGDGWLYYERTVPEKPYPLHCRKLPGGGEVVILDENARAEGQGYYHCAALAVSPSGRFMAFAEDTNGSERYTIRFRDLELGQDLPHVIEGAKTSLVWADERHLFYTTPDATDRPFRLHRHDRLAPDSDAVVFEEPDGAFFLGAGRSRDGRWIVASLQSKQSAEVRLIPIADPLAAPRLVWERAAKVEYEVEPAGDVLHVLTNRGGATNFQVVTLSAETFDEIGVTVPHDPDVYLTGIDAFQGRLVLWERREGLPTIRVLRGRDSHVVSFDEATWTVSPGHNALYETDELRFVYQSLVTPPSVFAYDMGSRERTLLKRDPVPGYDASRYVTERLWARSHDGVLVPISLVRRRDVAPGDNPCLLAGYGSYGITSDASFRGSWVSLLDRGVVCAIAHIRGGGELGRPWYESGKFLKKRNTFLDFVACAEHLVGEGWTRPERLGIWGGSAGGLLMGAVINARPELFRCVLALVPFVDVVTTMFDESLPLTVTEYEEWGNPHEHEYFEYMLSYSPYDNVRPQAYPDVLITAGLNDPRVGYWEPAKWAARLRALKTGPSLVLLKTHLGAGHAGASGRYGRIEEIAFEYAFFLDRVGAAQE